MADQNPIKPETTVEPGAPRPGATRDEVALELMKFIAVTTGYGKGGAAAGFGGKTTRTAEEYAESLLQLFGRCREVVQGGQESR